VLQHISHPNVSFLPPPTIITTSPTMESEKKLVKDVNVRASFMGSAECA